MSSPGFTPVPLRLSALATARPGAPAITDDEGTLTRDELDRSANRLARRFTEHGVTPGSVVVLALPSGRSMVLATVATWKVGAIPQPVPPAIPVRELESVIALSRPALVVGAAVAGIECITELPDLSGADDAPLPPLVAPAWKACVSGGSTGRPKVIVSTSPALAEPLTAMAGAMRLSGDDVLLVPAPLHHNGPFMFAMSALMLGTHVVLGGRFDAEKTLRLIQEHRVTWSYMVPTMMSRISKLPPEVRGAYDVSSLHTVFHMAAPCPPWLKEDWIAWLGPDVVWELYAGTEGQAATIISGTEWLAHRGSVGRAVAGEITVLDAEGEPVPPGAVGEVWMRPTAGATYRYLGAEPKTLPGGWESLGDLGSFDEDGYLYLSDRLADMLLVGGVNVYPAEVEAALDEHPQVLSSCVIGLPDDDLGTRVHALVQLDGDVGDEQLADWCAARLTRYKVPRSFERVLEPLRDEAAKVRRSALRAARVEDGTLVGNAP